MADFDLVQTDAQVQSILNDGQNMQGAGAQTTLTTESVLLKDVNGNYHKILKSSFTEAIRDTLAGLLVNNDKGTTINQIAAIASGDFGSITPANLASVLGAINDSFYGSNFNLDEFNMSGIFFLAKANCENAPSSANDGIFISHIGNKAYQIWISTALSSTYGIFIRAKNTSWGAWYRFNLTS